MKISRTLITHSNIIEGTVEQGISGPIADNYSAQAWMRHLEDRALDDVTLITITDLQHDISGRQKGLKSEHRGVMRGIDCQVNVRAGSHIYPHWSEVGELMKAWINTYRDMSPIDAHVVFEKIHPLVDVNGRVGRMLLWHHQLAVGEMPMQVGVCNKGQYFTLFD